MAVKQTEEAMSLLISINSSLNYFVIFFLLVFAQNNLYCFCLSTIMGHDTGSIQYVLIPKLYSLPRFFKVVCVCVSDRGVET